MQMCTVRVNSQRQETLPEKLCRTTCAFTLFEIGAGLNPLSIKQRGRGLEPVHQEFCGGTVQSGRSRGRGGLLQSRGFSFSSRLAFLSWEDPGCPTVL
jgi:hypothetical protein